MSDKNNEESKQNNQEEAKPNITDMVKEYVDKRNAEKQNMIDKLSKQEMANIIFKQNDLLAQQSSQMLEIVEMANSIEKNARTDESNKCARTKNEHTLCAQVNTARKQQLALYENSVRIQIVLFILLITILAWLLYHYTGLSGSESE